ncbi:hypothetical protein AOLI_G00278840 [Acnodon oligacanthus]
MLLMIYRRATFEPKLLDSSGDPPKPVVLWRWTTPFASFRFSLSTTYSYATQGCSKWKDPLNTAEICNPQPARQMAHCTLKGY